MKDTRTDIPKQSLCPKKGLRQTLSLCGTPWQLEAELPGKQPGNIIYCIGHDVKVRDHRKRTFCLAYWVEAWRIVELHEEVSQTLLEFAGWGRQNEDQTGRETGTMPEDSA